MIRIFNPVYHGLVDLCRPDQFVSCSFYKTLVGKCNYLHLEVNTGRAYTLIQHTTTRKELWAEWKEALNLALPSSSFLTLDNGQECLIASVPSIHAMAFYKCSKVSMWTEHGCGRMVYTIGISEDNADVERWVEWKHKVSDLPGFERFGNEKKKLIMVKTGEIQNCALSMPISDVKRGLKHQARITLVQTAKGYDDCCFAIRTSHPSIERDWHQIVMTLLSKKDAEFREVP